MVRMKDESEHRVGNARRFISKKGERMPWAAIPLYWPLSESGYQGHLSSQVDVRAICGVNLPVFGVGRTSRKPVRQRVCVSSRRAPF